MLPLLPKPLWFGQSQATAQKPLYSHIKYQEIPFPSTLNTKKVTQKLKPPLMVVPTARRMTYKYHAPPKVKGMDTELFYQLNTFQPRLTTLASSVWRRLWGTFIFLLFLRTETLICPYCHPDGV